MHIQTYHNESEGKKRVWRIEVIWEKFNYLTPAVSGETDAHGLISTSTVDSLSLSLTLSLLTVQSVCCVCVCGLQRCKHKDYICYVPGPLSRHHRGQKEPTTPSQKHTHSHIHHRNPTASAAVHLTDTKPVDIKQKGFSYTQTCSEVLEEKTFGSHGQLIKIWL